ncbi:sulfur carrier protein ThiS [Synechococcus sp. RSCCF101]|uniref:sulfur carrier protein ThiS n=1 Tax=Synechococcus sp. RSCCF101 TaxID=2511069 RepID=UPI0012491237|nr:sulfur carrier protein ThiS [Synechococcus sp. RSCCF101]QEY31947.1 sulfur carrier protein ThiS [Synechococcus sp. RSCCF101]
MSRPPSEPATVQIQLNGAPHRCAASSSLDALLRGAGYNPDGVVVEVNGVILPRPGWSDHVLAEGDVLEVVTIVGGGS